MQSLCRHGHFDPLSRVGLSQADPGGGDVAVEGHGALVVRLEGGLAGKVDGAGEVERLDLGGWGGRSFQLISVCMARHLP